MTQLSPSQYLRLSPEKTYGQSDGLYWDATNSQLVMVISDAIVARIDATGISADLEFSNEARGDIIRRNASSWGRHAAKTSGQVLLGDGTDIVSTAISGVISLSGAGVTALSANLAKGHIPLDLTTAKIIAGDVIGDTTEGLFPDGNTAPSLQRVNSATDKALRLIWAASSSIEIAFAPIVYPGDLDDTAAVTVHILAAMEGVTDTPTIAIGYFEGVGDTNAGGNTAAITGTSVAEYTVSIAHGDIGAHPKAASIVLTPGAHTTDALYIYGAWVEYTRKA